MADCPECFREVVPVHNVKRGIGRVAWWCENCSALYPDADYVEMRDRPLGMPRTDGGKESANTPSEEFVDDRCDAVLSDDGDYRYRLRRQWDQTKPTVAWIMLNPSTADATTDDPTVRRCLNYANRWDYGTLLVGNLFALRTPDPDDLRGHPAPVGPANDAHLQEIVAGADLVVCAWGSNGSLYGRASEVATMLNAEFRALNTTQAGHPVHPLYQPADADPELWSVNCLDSETR